MKALFLTLSLVPLLAMATQVPVYNSFVLVPKENSTHCSNETFCPDGYLCYKLSGYKSARVCFPDGIDPSKDLSELLHWSKPATPINNYLFILAGHAVHLLLTMATSISLYYWLRPVRQLPNNLAMLPRQTFDFFTTQPRILEITAPRPCPTCTAQNNDGGEASTSQQQVKIPPPLPQLPPVVHHPKQYGVPPTTTRPVSSPHFPRSLVPKHLTHLAYQPPYYYEPEEQSVYGSDFDNEGPTAVVVPSQTHPVAYFQRAGSMRSAHRSSFHRIPTHQRLTTDSHPNQPSTSNVRSSFRRPPAQQQDQHVKFHKPPPKKQPIDRTPTPPSSEEDTVEAAVEEVERKSKRKQ